MAGHVAGQVAAELAGPAERQLLDAGHIGVAARQAARLRRRSSAATAAGGDGQHGDVGRPAGHAVSWQQRAGADAGRQLAPQPDRVLPARR